MARPNKIGLDYFPLDIGFFEDEKILAISGEFAVKGEIVALRLLCEIYRNGYFVEYSELLKMKMARLGGLSSGLIDEVVNKLVKYEFFDEFLFREKKILTSSGIQKRFLEATKRRKNIDDLPFLLVNVYNNYASSKLMHTKSTQSKVKESKVNILLEKESKGISGISQNEKQVYPGNIQNKELKRKKVAQKKENDFSFRNSMIEYGFDEKLTDEFLRIRKIKKAVNSEFAFENFIKQVEKANQNPNYILKIITEKQWKGFQAEWISNQNSNQNGFNQSKNNAFSNSSGNTTGGQGGKVSARTILARKLNSAAFGNNNGQNITIDAEIVQH